jgi:hypothetical protein
MLGIQLGKIFIMDEFARGIKFRDYAEMYNSYFIAPEQETLYSYFVSFDRTMQIKWMILDCAARRDVF